MGRGPDDHRRRCIAALVKVGVHLVIDAAALNEVRGAINLMHDAAVMRNVSRILDLPEAAAASNRMMGAGVATVTKKLGLGELASGASRDLDVDYLIDRAVGVTPTLPSIGRTLWGFLPGASTVIAGFDAIEECR